MSNPKSFVHFRMINGQYGVLYEASVRETPSEGSPVPVNVTTFQRQSPQRIGSALWYFNSPDFLESAVFVDPLTGEWFEANVNDWPSWNRRMLDIFGQMEANGPGTKGWIPS